METISSSLATVGRTLSSLLDKSFQGRAGRVLAAGRLMSGIIEYIWRLGAVCPMARGSFTRDESP